MTPTGTPGSAPFVPTAAFGEFSFGDVIKITFKNGSSIVGRLVSSSATEIQLVVKDKQSTGTGPNIHKISPSSIASSKLAG